MPMYLYIYVVDGVRVVNIANGYQPCYAHAVNDTWQGEYNTLFSL